MTRQRWIGVFLGLLLVTCARAQTQLETDEQTLKNHKPPIPTDAKGLIEFFVKRSPKDGEAKHMELLVRKLGSDVYAIREPAKKELIERGPLALPYLSAALTNSSLEMKRRAELCIKEIEDSMKAEPISAAARVLAARKEAKAAEALFNFLPVITADPFLEEEVMACVGRLTITPDKVDPLLLDALKDKQGFRRTVAAYLIGRRANADHREELRKMLADADPRVSLRIAEGLFGKRPGQVLAENLAADEKLLKDNKVSVGEADLLKFFRERTPSADDQKKYRALVKAFAHDSYAIREQANKKLLQAGVNAIPFLKEAEHDVSSVERARRAQDLLREIRQKNLPSVPIAGIHLLARPAQKKDASPSELIRTLLDYVPFADDEIVEEEVLSALTLLSLREPAIEPELLKALSDASPTRRGAAAYVLGHVGTKEQVAKVQDLLNDTQPLVRFRAAQGMLAARSRVALPSLVNLLEKVPTSYVPKVEEALQRVAGDQGPLDLIAGNSPDSAKKAVKAWNQWLADNKDKIDLTSINDRESYLGLVTICEYDNQVGNIQGQVWEGTKGGVGGSTKRWNFQGVMGAMDAHTLPNGRVLVAENNANRVSERTSKGDIVWEYRTPNNPICCQRLPNGNTFIASYNMVMEVTPNKTVVYQHTPGPQFYIFSAHKAKNGNIVAITAQGQIMEMDSKTGQTKNTVQTNTLGNWCSVEMLPNGNYLVAAMSTNTVKEIARVGGAEVWSKPFPGVFRATRLPNGNVLVCSMNTREVAEMDRAGTIRWRVNTTGRPWSVRYR